ncbi:hypothetical protein BH23BAC4_BH23BAC4_11900 [soil metagenome]
MAERESSSNAVASIAIVVLVIVALVALYFLFFAGGSPVDSGTTDINVEMNGGGQ